MNLENLFASLVNAGLPTSNNQQNVPAPSIASTKKSTPVVENDSNLRENAIREYRTAVLLEPVKLTTSDLVKYGDDGSFYNIHSHSACRANSRRVIKVVVTVAVGILGLR